MIDKETYGLEVEAKTSKAKKAFSDLANFIRDFGKQAKKETTITIDPSISKNELFKWQEDLKNSIKEAKLNVKNYKNTPTGHYYEEDLKKYQEGLELVDNRIKEIEEDEATATEELEEMGSQGEKSTSILSGLFDKSIGKIKRFTYYLLGARSVFSLFMKYQSIYYQYNEQMQYQSELSQNAIALSLAPAFEFLGNVIAYASIAFAKFIELLTGVNVLSKVSTKGIRDYNKALKESQSLLSGIDEITNLTLPSSTGLTSQYKALDEFQKKVAEVTEWFNKNKWIENLAEGLKKVWSYLEIGYNYIRDHWDIFKYIFGAVAIGLLWTNPVGKVGIIVAGIGLVVNWLDKLKNSNNKTKEATDRLYDSEKKLNDLRTKQKNAEDEYIEAVDEHNEKLETLTKLQNDTKISGEQLYNEVENGSRTYKEFSNTEKEVYKAYRDLIEATDNLNTKTLKYKNSVIQTNAEETKKKGIWMEINKIYDDTFNDLIKKYRNHEINAQKFTATVASYMEGMSKDYRKVFIEQMPDDVKEAWKIAEDEIGQGLKVSQAFTDGTSIKFEEFYKSIKNSSKNIKNVLDDTFKQRIINVSAKYNIDKNSVLSLVNKVKGISGLLGLPTSTFDSMANKILKQFGYAKGLDYVPYDNYPALLHKGEAVVPAKYNPTIHSEGNDYTNTLLETLVMKVDDLSRRPNVFEIDGQQFANATYGLYEDVNNRQGYVKEVVR